VKVLIAGAGGQVGRALQATAPEWAEVTALERRELDITDTASVRRAIETTAPEVVINAAAYTAVDRAESDEEHAFRVNGAGVAALAQVCAERSARLVHLSTDYVFDGEQSRPYRIDDKPSPRSVYGRSKLAGEDAALGYQRNLVLRSAWIYGHDGRNFVTSMLRLLAERDEVRVVADQRGTPTHARSLAAAIWTLTRRDAHGLLHFTDAGEASWYDFAVAIQQEALTLGLIEREVPIRPIATAQYPTPAERPAYSVLDCSACWALLGKPARDWRVELRDMLAAEKHG
jgi:dTDP-4-dehydrorhamnose reductase